MKRDISFVMLIIVCLCVGVATLIIWQYQTRHDETKIPLSITEGTGFLTFKAYLNGKEILMAVDTAANTTVFNRALIDELNLETKEKSGTSIRAGGSLPMFSAYVEDFRVGNISYHGDFDFVDLSHPNKGIEISGDPQIDGLLGADILLKWNAVIDYKELILVIRQYR